MASNLSLLDLPDELIGRIMSHCDPFDRTFFSATCKRIRVIFVKTNKFIYHLQGYSEKCFNFGLKMLLNTEFRLFHELVISDFELQRYTDKEDWLVRGELFGRPLEYYHENSQACNNVDIIRVDNCIVTDDSMYLMRKLFPKVTDISFDRCYFCRKKPRSVIEMNKNDFIPLLKLTLPHPFRSDIPTREQFPILAWILDNFIYEQTTKLKFQHSEVSRNRPVCRRFFRCQNVRMSEGPLFVDCFINPKEVLLSQIDLRNIELDEETRQMILAQPSQDNADVPFLNIFELQDPLEDFAHFDVNLLFRPDDMGDFDEMMD